MSPRKIKRQRKRKYKRRPKNFLPKAVLVISVVAFVLLVWRLSGDFFRTSPFFNVSKIELTMRPFLKEALSLDFYGIPRRCNIFQLDIEKIASQTQDRHPEFKAVAISRKPPDVISVRIEYKQPIAFLKTNRMLVPISKDGVVLPPEAAVKGTLPVLSGIDFQRPMGKVGSICPDNRLPFAIEFLALAQSHWSIKGHRINTVDLSNTRDVSIFLENDIEIKMGDGSGMKKKLTTLKNILSQPKFDLGKIKYIDLRFSEIVIGPKILTKK